MCRWREVAFLLKASTLDVEEPLFRPWVRAYLHFMPCFPQLNVVSDEVARIRHHFAFCEGTQAFLMRKKSVTSPQRRVGAICLLSWRRRGRRGPRGNAARSSCARRP